MAPAFTRSAWAGLVLLALAADGRAAPVSSAAKEALARLEKAK